jgi:hypothetical protein
MTWIGITDHQEGRFSVNGLGLDRCDVAQVSLNEESVMPRGTLMVETRMSPNGRPQVLFGFKKTHPWERAFSLQAIPGGGIAMVYTDQSEVAHAAQSWKGSGRTDVVRITYAWDAPVGWGRFSLERPEEATFQSVTVTDPKPLSAHDLRQVILGHGPRDFSTDVVFAAVSDEIEPIGPSPTLSCDTPIATPFGFRPVSRLMRGDTVISQSSGVVPVLHQVTRTVPALGSFRPIRLRAPYFGLQQDIIAAPDQRLIIRGSEVEYNFGQEAVLVPARHLVNGYAAFYEAAEPIVQYTQLLLPEHEEINAAGSSIESLYVGRLRRKPVDLGASVLADASRNSLPEHAQPVFSVLRSYEAVMLVDQRAA